jgi:uncharacterized protein (DUF1330 family)
MSKGYWVGAYRSISDPTALASHAKLAGPAVEAAGGRFLARGGTVKTHEAGVNERTVLVEFASFELAQAAYESKAYSFVGSVPTMPTRLLRLGRLRAQKRHAADATVGDTHDVRSNPIFR